MFAVVITEKGGAQRREQFDQSEVTIGRVQGNDIILPKGNVSKRHSRIVLKDGRFIVVDLKSTNGTYVNGRKITSPLVVKPGDKIYIGDFILSVEPSGDIASAAPSSAPPDGRSAPPSSFPPPKPSSVAPPAPRFALEDEPRSREASSLPAPPPPPPPPPQNAAPAERVRAPRPPALATETGVGTGDEQLRLVLQRVATEFDVHAHLPAVLHDQERWTTAQRAIQRAVDQLGSEGALGDAEGRDAMIAAALREAVGLGALEALLADERIHELVVNGPAQVMADRGNGLEATEARFSDSTMLATIARRLLAQGGKDLDPTQPMHQVVLPYGPHVTVLMPPFALRGPVLEIRRIRRGRTLDDLVARGVLSNEMRELLRKAVTRKRRIAVVGPSSSGVTTLLAALAQLADERERLVTVESVADLALDRPGTVTLAAGAMPGKVGLADAIKQASQLRSDRLVVDDVAGGPELAAALTALATRHAGDLVGVHGGRDTDCLGPLRLLLSLGISTPEAADRLLGRAIDLVVEVDRLEEGNRVVAISEIVAQADGKPRATRLFTYDGAFVSAGQAPAFLEA